MGNIVIGTIVAHPGLSRFKAYFRIPMFWQSESGQDIAVSVYDILWNGPRIYGSRQNTRDFAAISNPFQAGDDGTTAKEY